MEPHEVSDKKLEERLAGMGQHIDSSKNKSGARGNKTVQIFQATEPNVEVDGQRQTKSAGNNGRLSAIP